MTVTKIALVADGRGCSLETFFSPVMKDTDFPNLSPHNPDLPVTSPSINVLP